MLDNYKGIIDLEQFLLEKYNYKYINLIDLEKQQFTEIEAIGASALIWIIDGNDKYLFKASDNYIGELLSMKFANILNIPCAEYKPAKLGDITGILSKKFTKDNEIIILGAQIIQYVLNNYPYKNKDDDTIDNILFNFLYNIPSNFQKLNNKDRVKYIHNYLNNLEELTSIIDIYFDLKRVPNKEKLLKETMEYLVNKLMFDIITIQTDSHVGNWGIGYKDGNYNTICLYDNNASFNIWKDNVLDLIPVYYKIKKAYLTSQSSRHLLELRNFIYKNKPLLSVSERDIINAKNKKRKNCLEVLDSFLEVSSYEYTEKFNNYLEILENYGIETIIEEVEKENGIKINIDIKNYIIDIFNLHMYFCMEIVEKYKRGVEEVDVLKRIRK